jgi:hypothetical protein
MGKAARKIENKILSSLPENKRLFKINAGRGWQGKVVKHTGDTLILKNPQPVFMAPTGWPDLCGWETVTVTPEMVGQKVAIFTGEEVKAGKDRLTKEQSSFGKLIERMGGIFRVVRG